MRDSLEIGDKVRVYFCDGKIYSATIVWRPYDTDDKCWYLRNPDNNCLWTINPYASDFSGMALVEEEE